MTQASTPSGGIPAIPPGGPDEVLVGHDEIRRATERLRDTASDDWMVLEAFELPLPGRGAIDVPAPRREGIRMRAVYDERFLRDPAGLQIIRTRVAAGEEARIHARVDYRLRVSDTRSGLVIMTPSWAGFALLIHSASVMTRLSRQFERAWDLAVPFEAVPSAAAAFHGPGWFDDAGWGG